MRTLLKDTDYLILDEPLNHLDDCGQECLLAFLKKDKRGVIYASHQPLALDETINVQLG